MSSVGGKKEDLINKLQKMREDLNPFRQELVKSLTKPTDLTEINNLLEFELGETNHKFSKVRGWLSVLPSFALTAAALTASHVDLSESAAILGSEVMPKICEDIQNWLKERKYGFSAFKEVFRGPVRLGPGTDEAEAYKLARQIILG